jgi:crotonobetainyl-CoA:carnitine CoA-transferase CaiB-like acyl-CoA transferase
MRTRTTAQWRELLTNADIPNTPMNSVDDILSDEHLRATGFIYESDLPGEGPMLKMRAPTRWSGTPLLAGLSAAPHLGQDSAVVLHELGYSEAIIADLMARGICKSAA